MKQVWADLLHTRFTLFPSNCVRDRGHTVLYQKSHHVLRAGIDMGPLLDLPIKEELALLATLKYDGYRTLPPAL